MKSQEVQEVYNRISMLVDGLQSREFYPCLRYEATVVEKTDTGLFVPKHVTCILKQYEDNTKHGNQGFFPDIMCPTCRLTYLAVQAEKEMREEVRVEQLKEVAIGETNVWRAE